MFDDISKTTIIQNFKKKSKYIKKNNLFEFQNESISVINEFLAYIVGFNNYKEFLSTDFSSNDSRFDLFYYRYQSNKKYLLKRTYLFLINLEKNNNKNKDILNMDRGQLNDEIDSMLLDDMFYRSRFYSDICLLEGDNKKFAYKRIDNIYDNIKHNKLIILNDFNSENSYNYLQKVIFENNNNIKNSIICNLSSLNLNNDSIKEYTGIEGWLELKNDLIKNMGARIDNEMKDVVKTPKRTKKKNLFLIVDCNFFQPDNGIAAFVAFSRSHFNLFIIANQISLMIGDENEIKSVFCNSFLRFVNLSDKDFDKNSLIFKLFFESINFPDNDILNQFKDQILSMKPYNGLISEVASPNLPYYCKYSFVEKII